MARSSRSLLQRETKYGVWTVKRPLRPTQYHFGTETRPYREFGKRWYIDALECQAADPVKLHEFGGRTWWWFKKQVYVERERLAAEDVKALALQLESAKSATLERARAEMRGEAAAASARAREPIPEAVRHEVWRRDQGRCVDCGSRSNLELDHIIPWSEGGSNTARNLELRCETCNRKKARHLDGRTRGIGGSAPLLRAVSSDRGVAGASPAVMRLSRCRWPHRGGRLAGGAVDVREYAGRRTRGLREAPLSAPSCGRTIGLFKARAGPTRSSSTVSKRAGAGS